MVLTADDGTILKPKEGVVLDTSGHPLTAVPRNSQFRAKGRSFSFSLPIPAVVGAVLFIPFALAMGVAFISVIGVLLAIFVVLSTLSRLFHGRPHR